MSIMGTGPWLPLRLRLQLRLGSRVDSKIKEGSEDIFSQRVRGHRERMYTQREHMYTHTLTESIYAHTEHMYTHTLSGGNMVQVAAINLTLPVLTLNMNSNQALTHLYRGKKRKKNRKKSTRRRTTNREVAKCTVRVHMESTTQAIRIRIRITQREHDPGNFHSGYGDTGRLQCTQSM